MGYREIPSYVDRTYMIGKIYQYMRDRKIEYPNSGLRRSDFIHRSIMRSACQIMLDAVEKFGKCLDYSILFNLIIDRYDEWACNAKNKYMSYSFSTVRDVLYDLYDFVCDEVNRKI